MKERVPNSYPGVVTFGSSVSAYNGLTKRTIGKPMHLDSIESMFALGEEAVANAAPTVAAQSVPTLLKLVESITTEGNTALGPGVVYCLGMAAKFPGSKIMVCTDGQANVGLGKVGGKKEHEKQVIKDTYEKIARLAKKNNITVNVLSIRGEDCCLEYLGTLADMTSGTVDIVDPADLSKIVATIMSKPILASGVTVKVICPSNFVFSDSRSRESIREFGNVTADTDLTFSFISTNPFSEPSHVPFQVQLSFTRPDGAQVVRVITKIMPICNDHDKVEAANLKSSIVAMKAIQHSAVLAQNGDFETARANLITTMRLLQRAMHTRQHQREYINFIVQSEKLDGFMRQAQSQEAVLGTEGGRDDSAVKNIVQMKQANHSLFASFQ